MKLKILFIAWDNPASTYLEGLFMPIFEGVQARRDVEFHVVQFSWASEERISFLTRFCADRNVRYTHFRISTRPVSAIGKYLTLFRGTDFLKRYVTQHGISVIMPRSTMPARMTLGVARAMPHVKIVFDADGLPIEERVDFAGLKENSFRHRQLKKIEGSMIRRADLVLTRTDFAIEFLSSQYGVSPAKFFRVSNGRDEKQYARDAQMRARVRERLGIAEYRRVLVYCGSLGPQYGLEQMLHLFRQLGTTGAYSFLVITNHPDFIQKRLRPDDKDIHVVRVAATEVPAYLSAGDIGFAIRDARFSMRGVAPVKIGEYLLSGLPVIASAGIGDTEQILGNEPFCFILKDYTHESLAGATAWTKRYVMQPVPEEMIRRFGEEHFGLTNSVQRYCDALDKLVS